MRDEDVGQCGALANRHDRENAFREQDDLVGAEEEGDAALVGALGCGGRVDKKVQPEGLLRRRDARRTAAVHRVVWLELSAGQILLEDEVVPAIVRALVGEVAGGEVEVDPRLGVRAHGPAKDVRGEGKEGDDAAADLVEGVVRIEQLWAGRG